MSRSIKPGKRKRRTREHVIEEQSVNFLERHVLSRNHQLHRPSQREYGWDATMFHFSDEGLIENGEVRFQLKATDELRLVDEGRSLAIEVNVRDLKLWAWETYPFVLVVFDARRQQAFWLHIQDYIQRREIDEHSENVILRVPIVQKLGKRSIDQFRRMSLETVQAYWERNPHRERDQ